MVFVREDQVFALLMSGFELVSGFIIIKPCKRDYSMSTVSDIIPDDRYTNFLFGSSQQDRETDHKCNIT